MSKRFFIFMFMSFAVAGVILYCSGQPVDYSLPQNVITTKTTQIMFRMKLDSLMPLSEAYVDRIFHFMRFMALGATLTLMYDSLGIPIFHRVFHIMFFGMLTACTDEYLQYFVKGRSSYLGDVFFDFRGVVLGLAIAWLGLYLYYRNDLKKGRYY